MFILLSLSLSLPMCSFSLGVDAYMLKHGCHAPLACLESLKGEKVSVRAYRTSYHVYVLAPYRNACPTWYVVLYDCVYW